MIKRILVALDPDEDTRVAERYAAEIGQQYGAEVTGLAVVDTHQIAVEVGPGGAVGAMHYADRLRTRLSDEARHAAHALATSFDALLERAHVRHLSLIEDGNPWDRIVEDAKYHDLLVIGREAHFFYPHPAQRTKTLDEVVKHGLVPTLAVGAAYRPIRRVLVAYDGSGPAARTLQRFAQLKPFGTDLAVEVVHVRRGDRDGERHVSALLVRLAADYLRAHGFADIREQSLEPATPGLRILQHVQALGCDLVVSGAHSVSAVHRLAFGSTTHALLQSCPVPFFLYH